MTIIALFFSFLSRFLLRYRAKRERVSKLEKQGKRLIVHAGRHKTGSSAIQQSLFSQLDHPEFDYLNVGEANASLIINRSFRQESILANTPTEHKPHKKIALEKAFERLRCAVDSAIKPNIILSAESVSLMEEQEFQQFLSFFSDYFEEIELHAYFRPPKSDMESAFAQRLKHGFASCSEKVTFMHKRRFEMFEKHLGRSSLHYYRYDRTDFPSKDVVAHFCQKVGLSPSLPPMRLANTRLSLPSVQLLYMYRKYYPEISVLDSGLIRALGCLSGPAFRYHSSLFLKNYEDPVDSFQWLEQRSGKSFHEDVRRDDVLGITGERDLLDLTEIAQSWLAEHLEMPPLKLLSGSSAVKRIADGLRFFAEQQRCRR
ncbi:MAG: hypothetical protein ABJN62_04370 [Halioglobus sp.]